MKPESTLQPLLSLLGSTAEAVAATLSANSIKGVRNTVRHLNPIVRFVQGQLRIDDFSLDLTQEKGKQQYSLRLILADGTKEEVALPPPVEAFLDAFNQGAYAELELPTSQGVDSSQP